MLGRFSYLLNARLDESVRIGPCDTGNEVNECLVINYDYLCHRHKTKRERGRHIVSILRELLPEKDPAYTTPDEAASASCSAESHPRLQLATTPELASIGRGKMFSMFTFFLESPAKCRH